MSYFGVSNPELNSPFYGIGAAKRGRARAQRKRFTHTQMAGRNGGFADPREIMAYHNKGELSDGATIQALSLFGIGAAGARKMVNDSHRSKQQAAMMGVRRQQASLRGFAGRVNQLGNPNNAVIYDDSRGGSWRIEKTLESQMGSTLRYSYRAISLDSNAKLGPFTIQGSFQTINPMLEDQAKANIEAYIATIPIDDDEDEIIIDGDSDAYEGGETNGDGGDATGNGGNGGQSNIVDISNLNFATANAVLDAFLAGSITYAQAAKYLQTHFSADYYSQLEIDDFLYIERNYYYTHPGFPKEYHDYVSHPSYVSVATKYREETPSSTWSIVTIKRGENQFSWAATSSNFPEATLSGGADYSTTSEAAKQKAIEFIDASVENYHNSKPLQWNYTQEEDTENGETESGNGGSGNGAETGGNGNGNTVSTSDLTEYTSAQDVIDGRKLGVIDYMDAFNTLVNQFGWSENEASEALRTESSSNEYYISDTDGDSFRETGVDNTQPVQIQTQEVVPAPSGPSFIEENKVALAGGAILVAGAAAMAYSNRRN